MAEILKGCEEFAVPYLDDIAVFSESWQDHIKHLDEVLNRLKGANLKVKPAKCKFAQDRVKYLGHVVGSGIRTPAEAKVECIKHFPRPKTKTDMRAFLGLTGYYQHYVSEYAKLAAPLTDSLKGKGKKGPITWTDECEQAFESLKEKLMSSPVLHAPNPDLEFFVQTDASDVALGVVLTQNPEGEEHPILYMSRKFTPAEKRYSVIERECLAIVFAIRKLHFYLDGARFTIVTDHQPLKWLRENHGANARLTRWSLLLQTYQFSIKHRAGRKHINADVLSRIEIEE